MKIQSIITVSLIILVAVTLRVLPHPANFAPIAALALFGGVYLDKKIAFILPLTAMILSDLFLGFHASMWAVYGSFLLTVGIGIWLKNHQSFPTVILASLASSVLFFVLTNFNFWYAAALYPKTMSGLVSSYANAVPFFRNTVLGDLFYTGLFFGSYELAKSIIMQVKKTKVPMSV